MKEKRFKLYYLLWVTLGIAITLFAVYLSVKKPGLGVLVELFIALTAFSISWRSLRSGILIIGGAFLIKLIAYTVYCSTWSAEICQRNLVILSAGSAIIFGAIWIVPLTYRGIEYIYGLIKNQ